MLKITKGFRIDQVKTASSYDGVIFSGGEILNTITDTLYVRKGFILPKIDTNAYVYYDPMLDVYVLKNEIRHNDIHVYICRVSIVDKEVSVLYTDGTGENVEELIQGSGIVYTEDIVVDEGKLTLLYTPNVIIEIYVDGYGFMDASDGVTIGLKEVDLGTTELDGMTVRIVYET
jgi:hypothetical protein